MSYKIISNKRKMLASIDTSGMAHVAFPIYL